MGKGKISEKLINFANALVGYLPGGLAMAGTTACGLFGAISGAATPTLVAIGGVMFPSLVKSGYKKRFSIGIITSSAILGIIIPPSIPMIFYAMLSDVSVGKMFAAGFIPGIILIIIWCIYSAIHARRSRYQRISFKGFRFILFSIKDGIWALVLPLIIFVGIFSGVFSATEAGAVASVYALFVELFIYRELTKTDLWNIMVESGVITASFLIIVAAASTFTDYLALEEIPLKVTAAVISIIKSKWIFVLFVNLILLIVGTFIDVISAIVLLCPIFIPLLVQFKIDPIHFGIIMVLNLGIGYITPPLGLNLFVSAAMNKEPVYEISKAILPSFILLIIALLIITYIPKFTLFIPNLLFK